MTTIAAATSKATSDTSIVGGILGKTGQDGESGQFAQMLTDADGDAEPSASTESAAESSTAETDAPQSTTLTGILRFRSLGDIASFAGAKPAAVTASTTPAATTAAATATPAALASTTTAGTTTPAGLAQANTDAATVATGVITDPAVALAAQADTATAAGLPASVRSGANAAAQTVATQAAMAARQGAADPTVAGDTIDMPQAAVVQQSPASTSPSMGTVADDAVADSGLAATLDLAQLVGMAGGTVKTGSTVLAAGDADDAQPASDVASDDDEAVAVTDDTSASNAAISFSTDALLRLASNSVATPAAKTAAAAADASVAPANSAVAALRDVTVASQAIPVDADGKAGDASDDDTADFQMPGQSLDTDDADGTDVSLSSDRAQKAADAAKALGLSMSQVTDDPTSSDDSAVATASTDTVVVLDSRRYLGFGIGSNASALLQTMSGNKDWTSALQSSAALADTTGTASTGNVVNTLKLRLSPEHLGNVTANMRLVGDQLSIHLTVHNAAAYQELQNDSKPMLESLRSQGFAVDQVTVSLSAATDSGANSGGDQSQNNGTQAQQQQLARDGEGARQQAQSQGQQRSSGSAAQIDTERRNDTAPETSGSGGTGTGSLYL